MMLERLVLTFCFSCVFDSWSCMRGVLVILPINVPYHAGHLARIAATVLVSCLFDSESCVHGGLILSINVPYNAGHLERIAATVQVFGARMHCLTWGLAGGELAMRRRGCRGPCSSLLFRVTFQFFDFLFFLKTHLN